jgi:AraC family transcriptional regulator, transcriptional activator of pobA
MYGPQFAAKRALDIVQERLVFAARRQLVYTDAAVVAIACGDGFQGPAHFSRFFERLAGMAPRHFRQARETA